MSGAAKAQARPLARQAQDRVSQGEEPPPCESHGGSTPEQARLSEQRLTPSEDRTPMAIGVSTRRTANPTNTSAETRLSQRPKPAPDVFLLAARELGVEPPACVVVEDTPTGVRSHAVVNIGHDS